MTQQSVVKIPSRRRATMSKADLIRALLDLRDEASALGMSRVTLCLDYAHWEGIAAVGIVDPP